MPKTATTQATTQATALVEAKKTLEQRMEKARKELAEINEALAQRKKADSRARAKAQREKVRVLKHVDALQKYLPTLREKIQQKLTSKWKKRHVRGIDVRHFFGDMPGDETLRIEAKPQTIVKANGSIPLAHGQLNTDGTVFDTTGHLYPSLNQWVKTWRKDSPWRKVFYKEMPLEVYRQLLIQEGGDLFYPRFHEKNRKRIGHRDYLKEFLWIQFGIQVCENRPAHNKEEQPTHPE